MSYNKEKDIADKAKDVELSLESKVEKIGSAISSLSESSKQLLGDSVESIKHTLTDCCIKSRDTMEDTIKDKPFRSAVTCLGVGVLIGLYISRKER